MRTKRKEESRGHITKGVGEDKIERKNRSGLPGRPGVLPDEERMPPHTFSKLLGLLQEIHLRALNDHLQEQLDIEETSLGWGGRSLRRPLITPHTHTPLFSRH